MLVLVVAVLGLVVTGLRYSYRPRGSALDIVLGKHEAGRPETRAVSPSFERWWRAGLGAAVAGVVWVGAARQLPHGAPPGVVLFGAVVGSLTGLLALGIVLVYRANRIINFAQAAFGSIALVLTFELKFTAHWPYPLAALAGTAAAAALAGGAEVGVMRRFREAPRLILTLGTIGLANLFLFVQVIIVVVFERNSAHRAAGTVSYPSPYGSKAFTLSGIAFSHDVLLAIVIVPLVIVMLVRFLQRSWTGLGIRAAAENADRASLLAVPVGRLSTGSWVIAGALSAIATLLRAPITGYSLTNLASTGFLAVMLTAVVIGRLESLTLTFLGAVAIGITDQLYFYNYSRGAPIDAIHLGIILVALLLLPRARARVAWNEVSSWRSFREVRPIPAELAGLPEVRAGRRVFPLVALGLAALVPVVVSDISKVRLASLMGIWAIAAVSLVILTGWAGQISLGQWSIVGVGAFTAGRLLSAQHEPSIIVILVASGLAGGIVAAGLGLPAIRLRGVYLAIVTFGFAAAAATWFFTWKVAVPTADLVRPPQAHSERGVFYLVLGLLALSVVVARNLRRSRIGRVLVATRDNPRAAESYGIAVLRARLVAFVVSGVFAGIAGGLYATMNLSVRYQDFGPERSLQLFAIAVIGGLGSISGALIGAFYVVGAGYLLPSWGPFLATGLGMLVFLMVFPGGLGQLVYNARDSLLRRVARRHGVVSASILADLRVGPTTAEPDAEIFATTLPVPVDVLATPETT